MGLYSHGGLETTIRIVWWILYSASSSPLWGSLPSSRVSVCPLPLAREEQLNLLVASVSCAGCFLEGFFPLYPGKDPRKLDSICVDCEPEHRLKVMSDSLGFIGGLSLHDADSVDAEKEDGWYRGRA